MTADVALDSCEEIDDSLYAEDSSETWHSPALWNGREVRFLKTEPPLEVALKTIHSQELQTQDSLINRHIEQLFCDVVASLEELLEQNGYEFDRSDQMIQVCKSFKAHFRRFIKETKKGIKKTGKFFEKSAKKAHEVTKKAIDQTRYFVKEHKAECLIAAGIILGIVAGISFKKPSHPDDDKDDEPQPIDPPTKPSPSNTTDWEREIPSQESALSSAFQNTEQGQLFPDQFTFFKETPSTNYSLFQSEDLAKLYQNTLLSNPTPVYAEREKTAFLQMAPLKSAFSSTLENIQCSKIATELVPQEAFVFLTEHLQAQKEESGAKATTDIIGDLLSMARKGLGMIGNGIYESAPIIPIFKEALTALLNQGVQISGDSTPSSVLLTPQLFEMPGSGICKKEELSALLNQEAQTCIESTTSSLASTTPRVLEMIGSGIYESAPIISMLEKAISQPYETSRYYITEGKQFDHFLLTGLNGMNNTFIEAKTNFEYIRSFTPNLRVHGIYNKSNGVIGDILEIFLSNYPGYSPITQTLLMDKWIEFHEKNKKNPFAKCLHFCHSQGAIHTVNALERLPKEIRDRIIVVAIAPGKIVPKSLCYDSYNYASKNDLVHYGENLTSILGSAFPNDPDLQAEIIHNLMEHKKELILLDPELGAEGMDHSFMSPTFYRKIFEHIEAYLKRNGEYR